MASSITTRALFHETFPEAQLSPSVFDASHHTTIQFDQRLSVDAALFLLAGDLGRELHLCHSIVLRSHEPSRYFLIYEILKALIKVSHETIILQVRPFVDTCTSTDAGQSSELAQAMGFEQTVKGVNVSAKIEFVLMNKLDDKVLLVIQVKSSLDRKAYMWQALAEVMIIAQHNKGSSYVCLTDGFSWQLFKAQKTNDTYLVTASTPFAMFDTALRTMASESVSALSMLFSVMFRDKLVPTAEEIASAYEAVDDKLQKQTDFAASSLLEMMRAKEEAVKAKEEAVKAKKEAVKAKEEPPEAVKLREDIVQLKKRVSELEGPNDNQRQKTDS